MLTVVPIFQKAAFSFITKHHRHHIKPVGSIFQVAIRDEADVVGVAIVGRPVSRIIQEGGLTVEVTRLCTTGAKNACSMLYASCARISKEMGYRRIITYILSSEPGTTLRASGWKIVGETDGGSWSRPSRGRVDKHPIEKKVLYEKILSL